MTRPAAYALLASITLLVTACNSKPAPEALPPAPGPDLPKSAGTANSDYDANGNYIGPGSQTDLRRTAGNDRVFFDLDSYALDDIDRDTLGKHAAWLARYPKVNVTIEGHCDERGTREYNLALGERRANAAKNYLASLGVSPDRMRVISYGKERPEATGSDEQSWAQNRRAVTVVIR
jgi:peptidoglycan-associated lipoprotein